MNCESSKMKQLWYYDADFDHPFYWLQEDREFCLKPLLLVFECDGCFNCSTSIVMNDLSRRADWSIVEAAKSNYLTETFSSWHDLCFPSTTTLPQLNLMKATANYLNIRFDHKLLTPLTTSFKFFCLFQDFGDLKVQKSSRNSQFWDGKKPKIVLKPESSQNSHFLEKVAKVATSLKK